MKKKKEKVIESLPEKLSLKTFQIYRKKTFQIYFPNPDTRRTEDHKQVKPKQTHTKMYYNKNGKC